jgi:hypothetical protein
VVSSTVVGSRKPATKGESFEVEVAFEEPANVWGIAFPPEDWRSFKKIGEQIDQARLASRSLGGDIPHHKTPAEPQETPHVLPFLQPMERTVKPAESSAGTPREIENVRGRLSELERQIEQVSRTLAQLPAQRNASGAGETDSVASAKLNREIQTALSGMGLQFESKMQLLREAEQRVSAEQKHLDESLHTASNQARATADQCVRDVASEFAAALARAKAELAEATAAAVREQIELLNSKSEEVTQTTFDSLHKAAEWCHGKAQAGIQDHLDRTLERVAASLQEKAAEVSSLFASELDQYSRRFVTHTKNLIEEGAAEQIENSREQWMHREGEMRAKFEANFQQLADDYRKRLEELTSAALQDAQARAVAMINEQDAQFRITATQGVTSFQERISQRAAAATEDAIRAVESKLTSLLQTMRNETEEQRGVWNQRRTKELEESIAQFRQSLESASSSCRAANIALLIEDSQKLRDKLAAGMMYGLQQSAVKSCVELAKVLSQKSIAPPSGLNSKSAEEKDSKNSK